MRIAIVEDNINVAKGIAYRLQDRGHATDILHDGIEADAFLRRDGNDLIVLDIKLPSMDGITILRNLRARGDQRPVLLLTANNDSSSLVAGLDAGADDYLTKPFEMEVLEARLRALGRRKATALKVELRFGDLAFNISSWVITCGDQKLEMPRRERALLEILMSSIGRNVPKSALLEHLYGTGADVEDSAVEVNISRLRKRLVPLGFEIRVQRGLGYQLVQTGSE